ncbi:MAG: site-specific integrase [Promicromonosporaceae bacterium]|nr:site-specific integrase [Promicromonosporaceae bacterium]
MSHDTKRVIMGYEPEACPGDWHLLRPIVILLVIAYGPANGRRARHAAMVAYQFLHWYRASAYRSNPATQLSFTEFGELDLTVFDHWISDSTFIGTAAQRTVRTQIRRMHRNSQPQPALQLPRIPRKDMPLTAEQVGVLRLMVSSQPTLARLRAGALTFSLGLGAGLDSHDLRYLTTRDIDLESSPVTVTTHETRMRKQRTVPLGHDTSDLLRRGLSIPSNSTGIKEGFLFPQSANGVNDMVKQLINHTGIEYSIFKLRCTWLFSLLADTRIGLREMMYLAGLTSPSALIDLLPYLPGELEIDPTVVASTSLVDCVVAK